MEAGDQVTTFLIQEMRRRPRRNVMLPPTMKRVLTVWRPTRTGRLY